MKKLMFYSALVFSAVSCQKSSPPDATKYTLKGRIINATNNTVYIGQLELDVHTAKGTPSQYFKDQVVASGNTDATGYFSLTYTHTFTDHGAELTLESNFFSFQGIPLNQNDSQNFYNSSAGSMKIILHSLSPLSVGDTLFIGYPNSANVIQLDTILTTFNGTYKVVRSPSGPISCFYGRGWNNFYYNKSGGYFTSSKHSVSGNVTGDPVIDSLTVNY